MSNFRLVNVTSTERLAQGDALRITFSKVPYLINDKQFASHVNSIYEQLIGVKFSPISPDPSIANGEPAVIDIRLGQSMVLADMATILESIAGLWVNVSQIEKLGVKAASVSDTADGARERQAVSTVQSKKNDTSGVFGGIGNFLGSIKHIAVIVVIVVVIIALVVYHKEIAAGAKKLHWDT